jgi:hypothetical protein
MRVVCLLLLLALAGCASEPYGAKHGTGDFWRHQESTVKPSQ